MTPLAMSGAVQVGLLSDAEKLVANVEELARSLLASFRVVLFRATACETIL